MSGRSSTTLSTLRLPYGSGFQEVRIAENNLMGVIYPQVSDAVGGDEAQILKSALEHPVGTSRLAGLVKPGESVAVITSDITRPCPSDRILPFILAELDKAGVADEDIFIVIALGLHRPMSPAELREIVSSQIYRRFRVINHDLNDTVRIGTTSWGTPVELFRPVVEADVRICLGNLEFHWFAGYSGGAKAILPGCASRQAINANHGLMVHAGSATAHLSDNPLRQDLEEAAVLLGVDFILNVLVDGQHRILDAVAGDLLQAHRTGCEIVARRGMVPARQSADIVIASAGGFPKDINLFQAHKALENARHFARQGGFLILAAECCEGIGNPVYERWIKNGDTADEILLRIQREFEFGGHKAAAFARIAQHQQSFLVSALACDIPPKTFLCPFDNLQQAYDTALDALGDDSMVLVLPQAGSTVLAEKYISGIIK